LNHRAKKRFGQNFLSDDNVIQDIVNCIAPQKDDVMIEIGPGLGAMTIPLLDSLDKLNVIELDRDIIPRLVENCRKHDPACADRLVVNEADVLKFDFAAFHRRHAEGKKLRIVGNLPYNISTPILFHLLDFRHLISDMHFMLQKEVVDRICSPAGNKNYGRLSVMIQAYCQTQSLFGVPPSAFQPPPKVDSAIVQLVPRDDDQVMISSFHDFETLVRSAFSQRRKTLRNTLRSLCSAEQIEAAGFKPSQRAEELSVRDFVELYKTIFQDNHS